MRWENLFTRNQVDASRGGRVSSSLKLMATDYFQFKDPLSQKNLDKFYSKGS